MDKIRPLDNSVEEREERDRERRGTTLNEAGNKERRFMPNPADPAQLIEITDDSVATDRVLKGEPVIPEWRLTDEQRGQLDYDERSE